MEYYTILTEQGKQKILNASNGGKINLTKIVLGDSNGTYYEPNQSQTELKNKVWEGDITNISTDNNPSWIRLETTIPSTQGGFYIRELGILDSDGTLIAVGKCPQTYKPTIEDGSIKELYINVIIQVSDVSNINLTVNDNIVNVTKKEFNDRLSELKFNELEVKESKNISSLFGGDIIVESIKGRTRKGNLLKNSGYCEDASFWAKMIGGGAEGSDVILDNQKGVGIECKNNSGWCILYNDTFEKEGFKFDTSKQYTLNGQLWCSNEMRLTIQICNGNSTSIVMSDTSSYKQGYNDFSFTFTPATIGQSNNIRFCVQTVGRMFIKYVQLKENDTDEIWTPYGTWSVGEVAHQENVKVNLLKDLSYDADTDTLKHIKLENNIYTIENTDCNRWMYTKNTINVNSKYFTFLFKFTRGTKINALFKFINDKNEIIQSVPRNMQEYNQYYKACDVTLTSSPFTVIVPEGATKLVFGLAGNWDKSDYSITDVELNEGFTGNNGQIIINTTDQSKQQKSTLIIPTVLREFGNTYDEITENKIIRRINAINPKDQSSWTLFNPPKIEILDETYKIHGYPNGTIEVDNIVKPNMIVKYPSSVCAGIYTNSNAIEDIRHDMKKQQDNINLNTAKINAIENRVDKIDVDIALLKGQGASNIFLEKFENLNDINLTSGIWDKKNKRVVI